MIKVNQFIKTAFSIDDAKAIGAEIDKALKEEHEADLDFEGIQFYTTLFFNNAITKYIMDLGPAEYKKKFHLRNLNSAGRIDIGVGRCAQLRALDIYRMRVEIPSGKGLTSQPEASLGLSVVMLEVKRRQ